MMRLAGPIRVVAHELVAEQHLESRDGPVRRAANWPVLSALWLVLAQPLGELDPLQLFDRGFDQRLVDDGERSSANAHSSAVSHSTLTSRGTPPV